VKFRCNAYYEQETLAETSETGVMVYSAARAITLVLKGETSAHFRKFVNVYILRW
jgi:phosphoribosyl-AMP cyclohydrolase